MEKIKMQSNVENLYEKVIEQWQKKDISDSADLDVHLGNFKILFAYHSGVIENAEITYHNTREIFENGKVVNYTGDLRTLYEIENQKKCYEWLKDKIIAKEEITPELIKSIHKELTQGTYTESRYEKGERSGEYKKHDYVIGKNDQGALPEEVADEIEELCDELKEIPLEGENVLKAAAYLHCKFENTHPFADGNGRVGRTLLNYFLLTHSYPPVVIRNENKNVYYDALDTYDETGKISKMVEYLKAELVVTWQERKREKVSFADSITKESVLDKLHQNQEKVNNALNEQIIEILEPAK